MFNQFKRLLIGRPKKNRDLKDEKITKFKGLAILSSDALSSVNYGPEQILITLSIIGAVASWYTLPIAGAVLILLAALIMSYRQVIYLKVEVRIWFLKRTSVRNGDCSQVVHY